jgi:trk system potassium uptake protein
MHRLRLLTLGINLAIIILMVVDFGYVLSSRFQHIADALYIVLPVVNIALIYWDNLRGDRFPDRFSPLFLSILIGFAVFYGLLQMPASLPDIFAKVKPILVAGMLIYLVYALSQTVRRLYFIFFNPASVFIGSFAVLIFLGSFLLTLPQATVGGISYVDALFTATSAVAVTGLTVLDTGKDFTLFGQSVILMLIQLGGLGILTITSFFAYFFSAGSSYREGLYVKNFLSSESVGNVLGLAARIVAFTFSVELIGVALIFFSMDSLEGDMPFFRQFFFALFHSISGFCNAGFSTLSGSLYEETFRFNYSLHLSVALLFIIGGLGFNIAFNFYVYLKQMTLAVWNVIFKKAPFVKPRRVITMNTKIVVYTTAILILGGTIFLFAVEYHNTLKEHSSFFGKLATAFFTAVTPRTAGFNTVDTAALATPSILLILLLMWIGASPASTGGGIKTSTFALATLNIFSIARDKSVTEIGTREISRYSINRAFAIISLSLVVIGCSIFFVSVFEPQMDLLHVAFECVSAYSTVGLSLGVTSHLSDSSKIILMITMFVGRIGTINLMVGILRTAPPQHHQYPVENVLIN